VLFREALAHEWVHWIQHASFLGTALLFWWAMLRPEAMGRAQGIGHLFATSVHTSLLGALLVFSPRPWFEFQSLGAAAWGLMSIEDQQLAGLIMWVSGGLIYAAAALLLAGALITRAGAEPAIGVAATNTEEAHSEIAPGTGSLSTQ
jgi:cytochrome c oxidase assembly factor CtaG